MRTERFSEKQELGLHKLTGDNTGLVYANERQEQVSDEEGGERTEWLYDVYEVSDARDPHKVKNDVIEDIHPNGDEMKVLRKTLAKVLKAQGLYDDEAYAEFKAYNEFAESV
jgi:hypothetical protein